MSALTTVGIDVGINKASFSVWKDGKLELLADAFVSADYKRSYALMMLGSKVVTALGPWYPDHVFIEQNLVGNNVKYSINLAQMVGAISSACATEGWGVDYVNVSSWKKVVVGKGNAKKSDVQAYVDSTYPQYTASCDGVQDRYDAFCIGLYGVELVDLANSFRHQVLDAVVEGI